MHRPSTFNLLLAGASLASLARCQSASDESASMTIELQRGGVDISTVTAPSAEPSTVIATSTAFASPVDVITSTAPGSTVMVTVTSSSASSRATRDASDFEEPEDNPWQQMLNHVVDTCYSSDRENVDWNAPCPAVQAIQAQCTWGPEGLDFMKRVFLSGQGGSIPETWLPQPPDVQQACYCSSQYADVVLGCGDCMVAHGADEVFALLNLVTSNSTAMSEWSKLYCGADSKPEEMSFQSAVYQAFNLTDDVPSRTESSTTATSSTSTLSDPLNNATEISLYYTAVVTSAYVVALPTASSSANQSHPNPWFTYSNLKTSNGLIVPTAVAARSSASGSTSDGDAASGSGTTTAAAGAIQTAMVQSGLGMGAFGIAVLAWAL